MKPQQDPLKTLKQGIVQLSCDSRSLRETLGVTKVGSGCHLPEPQSIACPQQHDECHCANAAKQVCLVPGWQDLNAESCARLAPVAAARCALDIKNVSTRR